MEPLEGKTSGTSSPASVSTKLQRIAELAKGSPEMVMTTLAHHIDVSSCGRRIAERGRMVRWVSTDKRRETTQRTWRATSEGLTAIRGGWVLEVDITSFFDHLDHGHLRGFLDQRVRDGVLRRAIDKWLKAGVMEAGGLRRSEAGTPQGGVVSPLLANIYLHHVLDVWFESEVRPRLRGQAFLVRYADDFVIAFAREDDARRVLAVLPQRFGKYGLTLHPDKTRLVRFPQPPYRWRAGRRGNSSTLGFERPGTFDLLGFTHYWGMTRRGGWALFRKTASSRFRRSLEEAQLAISHGADALGLGGRMPSGPGVIEDALAAEIARATPPPIATLLLTAETTAEAIAAHVGRVRPAVVQVVNHVDPREGMGRSVIDHKETLVGRLLRENTAILGAA